MWHLSRPNGRARSTGSFPGNTLSLACKRSEGSLYAVTNPAKLEPDRSAMVCGHCHGQRLPEPRDRIHKMMSDGDPYDPGKILLEFYSPVQREDKIGSFSFAPRFWKTVRFGFRVSIMTQL